MRSSCKTAKLKLFIIVLFILGCTDAKRETEKRHVFDSVTSTAETSSHANAEASRKSLSTGNVYSNTRFKDVTVQKIAANTYRIEGSGQIFEATFGWVVEDGHNELKQGFQMTDAGAPEWGNFRFSIEAVKQRPNSTLTLILFESSPKDGSRQHELPMVLE